MKITGETSDGYHTFNELYAHRNALFIALQKCYPSLSWKSKKHSDGSKIDGFFLAGISTNEWDITYHIPLAYWDDCDAITLKLAKPYDGYGGDDVLERIYKLLPVLEFRTHDGELYNPEEYPCPECKNLKEDLEIYRNRYKNEQAI